MTPLHLGALHPVEQVLTLILAFGPFVLLAVVLWLRRRQDHADGSAPRQPTSSGAAGGPREVNQR